MLTLRGSWAFFVRSNRELYPCLFSRPFNLRQEFPQSKYNSNVSNIQKAVIPCSKNEQAQITHLSIGSPVFLAILLYFVLVPVIADVIIVEMLTISATQAEEKMEWMKLLSTKVVDVDKETNLKTTT